MTSVLALPIIHNAINFMLWLVCLSVCWCYFWGGPTQSTDRLGGVFTEIDAAEGESVRLALDIEDHGSLHGFTARVTTDLPGHCLRLLHRQKGAKEAV
mgnify:CR=1 FL=1